MDKEKLTQLIEEAKQYEKVSSEDLVRVFKDNHIWIPDFVDRFLLVNFFKKYVFDKEQYAKYTDEFKYRLRKYDQYFSIYLTEATDKEFNYSLHPYEYKNLFMRFFLLNKEKFNTTIAFEKALAKLKGNTDGAQENYEKVRVQFKDLYYTPKGYLDGIQLSILKEAVCKTYTLNQIRDLGAKYGVNVPKRMNKGQLLELIAARFRLTEDEKVALQPKPILELTQYSKEKGFKISTDLKKGDMVEFIVFSLNKYNEDIEKDLFDYDFIPEEEEVDTDPEKVFEGVPEDEVEAQEIPTTNQYVEPETPVEEVQEEPVVEEAPVEEVQEEPVQEEAPVEEAQPEVVEEPIQEEPVVEEVKEEEKPAPAPVQEEHEERELEYDESVDVEIRDIIKDYYKKKSRKDKALRITILIIFLVLVAAVAFFALKFFGVIK